MFVASSSHWRQNNFVLQLPPTRADVTTQSNGCQQQQCGQFSNDEVQLFLAKDFKKNPNIWWLNSFKSGQLTEILPLLSKGVISIIKRNNLHCGFSRTIISSMRKCFLRRGENRVPGKELTRARRRITSKSAYVWRHFCCGGDGGECSHHCITLAPLAWTCPCPRRATRAGRLRSVRNVNRKSRTESKNQMTI